MEGVAVDSTLCWEFNFFILELSMIFFWYDVCVVSLTEVDPEVTLIDIRASCVKFIFYTSQEQNIDEWNDVKSRGIGKMGTSS